MEEGLIHEWVVDEGESVSVGDTVLIFETEKTTAEIDAEEDGVLLRKVVEAGATVTIGTTLGYIGSESEANDIPTESDEDTGNGDERTSRSATDDSEEATPVQPEIRATPSARQTAREYGVDVTAVGRAVDVQQVRPKHVEQFLNESGALDGSEVRGSPAARRIAEDNDVEISEIGEAFETDRVRMADVDEYVEQIAVSERDEQVADELDQSREPTVRETIPITGGKKVMFDRMQTVSSTYGSTTTVARADVTELMDLLGSIKEPWREHNGVSPSLTAFVIRAVADEIGAYDVLNAAVDDSKSPPEVRTFEDVNIGIAVDTDHGLLVPTVYDADESTVSKLSERVASLATQAREQSLAYEQQQNGTFTVSNAGTFGAYINTPQINPPQTGILGVCTVNEEPGIVDGEIIPRKFVHLTLTYDHRVVEGGTAVSFLQDVKGRLEEPQSLLS